MITNTTAQYPVTNKDLIQALNICLWAFNQNDATARSLAIDQCLFCLGTHSGKPVQLELVEALKFASSVIKSREVWSKQCEEIIQSAITKAEFAA